MKRLRRWLFNLAAGVSLVVCVAAAVLWVRSWFVSDRLIWFGPNDVRGIVVTRGGLVLATLNFGYAVTEQPELRYAKEPSVDAASMEGPDMDLWVAVGFLYGTSRRPRAEGRPVVQMVQIPLWFVTLTTGTLGAVRLRKSWRGQRTERRRAANQCIACGYDLRATPERCPECGMVPEVPKGAA